MNLDDLKKIEASLNVKLPSAYSDFLLDYPLTQDQKYQAALREEIYDNYKKIVETNLFVRGSEFRKVREDSYESDYSNWPGHFFVFGESGCGDWHCLDLSIPDPKVYCWSHETNQFDYTAQNFDEHYQDVVEILNEVYTKDS